MIGKKVSYPFFPTFYYLNERNIFVETKKEKGKKEKKNWKNSVQRTKKKRGRNATKFVGGWTSGGQFRQSMCISFVHAVNKQQKIDGGERLLNIRAAMTAVARRIYLGRAG